MTTSFTGLFASFASKLIFNRHCGTMSIVICTVVRTAQLDCAVINSKPEHGSEKPGKTLEFDIGWLDRCDSSINTITK